MEGKGSMTGKMKAEAGKSMKAMKKERAMEEMKKKMHAEMAKSGYSKK